MKCISTLLIHKIQYYNDFTEDLQVFVVSLTKASYLLICDHVSMVHRLKVDKI